MKFNYLLNGEEITFTLEKTVTGYSAKIDEQSYPITDVKIDQQRVQFALDGQKINVVHASSPPHKRWLSVEGDSHLIEKITGGRKRKGSGGASGGSHLAPMPGQVREVLVAIGDDVEQGQTLLLLEAMKMEIRIKASQSGTVSALHVLVGQQVKKDDILIEIKQ